MSAEKYYLQKRLPTRKPASNGRCAPTTYSPCSLPRGYVWGQCIAPQQQLPCPLTGAGPKKMAIGPYGQAAAAAASLELVRCRCKTKCTGRCNCIKIQLKCTDLCACCGNSLRKIVRNQSKMIQRPFDDMGGILTWTNVSNTYPLRLHNLQMFPAAQAQMKTMLNGIQKPRAAALRSKIQAGHNKSSRRIKKSKIDTIPVNEVRLARNTFSNNSISSHYKNEVLLSEKTLYNVSSPLPLSNFFPSLDDTELQMVAQKAEAQGQNCKDSTMAIPDERAHLKYNDSVSVQGIIIRNETKYAKPVDEQTTYPEETDNGSEKADYLLYERKSIGQEGRMSLNTTVSQICTLVKTSNADIDAQSLFMELDIEPSWMSKKNFWSNMFDSRYESLMRNAKWPPLKVILVPLIHVDTIWKKTFEQYNNSVSKILSNIVKKVQFYSNLTFTWNEVSHLSQWWKSTSQKTRQAFRRLLKGGKIEITTGGWVETDEATTHLFGLIHLLIEGHQWLQHRLHYSPKVAWLTNTVTHSPTMAYLLTSLGITNLVFTNVHYSWEKYLAEFQISEFIWLQNWNGKETPSSSLNSYLNRMGRDSYPKNSIISHYLQFNSDGFRACGPKKNMCASEFNFAKPTKGMNINSYNVKEKAELLLEQYSKTGTITPHNVIIAPIGCPHCFEDQPEFDFQYNNYLKIADYVNVNRDIYKATVQFGTPSDFFSSIVQKHLRYPTLKGDFLNFADVENGSPAYWAGFFTSRPLLKILLRQLQSTLRSTEIILTFALSLNSFRGLRIADTLELLIKCREAVAQLMDRNVISGTLTANTLKYVHDKILTTAKNCWYIQEVAVSLLTSKNRNKRPYMQKYVYREGELISIFRTVGPGDQLFVFNSLSQDRPEVVELFSRSPNIRIVDHNRKDVVVQVNPVWKYNSDNVIVISRRFYKITFVIDVPPLTLELYKIKETYASIQNIATIYCVSCVIDEVTNNVTIFPFIIRSIETGDIQLESYKHRLVFDEMSGFLKAIVEKDTNIEKPVVLDYGAFRSSGINSGMFLFNTNMTKPLEDMLKPYRLGKKSKLVIIVSGLITTELTSVYGRLLQHTVKIFNLYNSPLSSAIYIESKVDYEVSPKNRDLELFLSIQTDIANGSPPEIYTDNNGFQYTSRVLNISRRVDSNVYPMTTMSYIQDRRRRLTCVTGHAQGVAALQEGQLLVLLERRPLRDDARGAAEGLAADGAATHRHYLLLENFIDPPVSFDHSFLPNTLQLPSLRANFLSNTLNYLLDIFVVNKTQADRYHYTFLPLIKAAFPCDISLLNYRVIIDSKKLYTRSQTTALMILHRQSHSCQMYDDARIRCDSDPTFLIDNILRNTKKVYLTNLCGLNKGPQINTIGLDNFPTMEILTLRVHF